MYCFQFFDVKLLKFLVILQLELLSRETGVWIDRYSFSEAQDGKGPCDRMAAYMKHRVSDHFDRGNDVETGLELFNAMIEGSKPLLGVSVHRAKIITPVNQ